MSESTYDVLARVLRDNEADAETYIEGDYARGYRDHVAAAGARIRAAMAGLPRPAQTTWQGKPPEPVNTAPPTRGRVIDADYSTVDEPGHSEWKPPSHLPSV